MVRQRKSVLPITAIIIALFFSLSSEICVADDIGLGNFAPNRAIKIKVKDFDDYFDAASRPNVANALYQLAASYPIVSTGFTAGSVIFSDGNSLAQDNSNLFWDDTNDRLGIGTTSPLATLQIEGDIIVQTDKLVIVDTFTSAGINAAIDQLGTEGGEVYLPEGTYVCTDAVITIDQNNTTLTGSGKGTILDFSAGQDTTTGCIDTNDKSYVVIQNLQILGSAGHGDTTALIGDNDDADYLVVRNCYLIDADYIGVDTNGDATKILNNYVENADNFGLLARDETIIENNLVVDCDDVGIQVQTAGACSILDNIIRNNSGTSLIANGSSGSRIIGNNIEESGTYAIRIGSLHSVVSGNDILNTTTGYADIYVTVNAVTVIGNKLRGSETSDKGIWFDNANYCIATNNTTVDHDVAGIQEDADCQNNVIGPNNAQDTTPYILNGVNSTYIITQDGNVGIGTTSPEHLLDVGGMEGIGAPGNLGIKSNSSAWAIRIEENSGVEGWHIGVDVDGDLNFDDSNTGIRLTFQDETGHVGIGTTSPGRDLEIYDSSPALRIRDSGATAGATTAFTEFGGTDAAAWSRTGFVGDAASLNADIYLQAEVGDLHLGDSSGSTVMNLQGGNVGIGVTDPSEALEVVGDVEIADDTPRLTTHDTGTGEKYSWHGGDATELDGFNNYVLRRHTATRNDNLMQFDDDNNVLFPPHSYMGVNTIRDYSGGNLILQDDAGNVGIGTTEPTEALDVNGRIELTQQSGSTNDGALWNDSTQEALQTFTSGIEQTLVGCIFTQTADQTIANTTTATTLFGTGVGTLTLPADFWVVGKTIRLEIHGDFADTGNPTARIKVLLDAVELSDSTAITLSGLGGTEEWETEVIITCRSVGGSGTVETVVDWEYETTTGSSAIERLDISGTLQTVDTTQSDTLDVTFQWGTAHEDNSLHSHVGFVTVLN